MITSNQLRFRGGQMVVRSITFRMMRSRLLSKSDEKDSCPPLVLVTNIPAQDRRKKPSMLITFAKSVLM